MPDCSTCDKVKVDPVPYIVHESDQARHERTVKRLIYAVLVMAILWFATIGVFVWYLNQYDFTGYSYMQDGNGLNIVGSRNGVDFCVSESDNP